MTFGIYIQVPFCQTKCTYCNFHTGVVSPGRYPSYADAVCREIAEFDRLPGRSAAAEAIDTVYFGGGTPSLLDPAALAKILDALRSRFRWYAGEVTLEADPETITEEKAEAWGRAGFNRISLGAQSFNDRELQAAGRMHRAADISRAVNLLRSAGHSQHQHRLDRGPAAPNARELGALRRRTSAPAARARLRISAGDRRGKPPGEGIARRRQPLQRSRHSHRRRHGRFLCIRAARALKPPATSTTKSPTGRRAGRRSRHNLKYWRREPYLGFGAGAHSFAHSEEGPTRWANIHDSAGYVCHGRAGPFPARADRSRVRRAGFR